MIHHSPLARHPPCKRPSPEGYPSKPGALSCFARISLKTLLEYLFEMPHCVRSPNLTFHPTNRCKALHDTPVSAHTRIWSQSRRRLCHPLPAPLRVLKNQVMGDAKAFARFYRSCLRHSQPRYITPPGPGKTVVRPHATTVTTFPPILFVLVQHD